MRGVWRIESTPASAILVIEPFEPLSHQTQNELQEEGERLIRWMLNNTKVFSIHNGTKYLDSYIYISLLVDTHQCNQMTEKTACLLRVEDESLLDEEI